jgi:hypothetical protein
MVRVSSRGRCTEVSREANARVRTAEVPYLDDGYQIIRWPQRPTSSLEAPTWAELPMSDLSQPRRNN